MIQLEVGKLYHLRNRKLDIIPGRYALVYSRGTDYIRYYPVYDDSKSGLTVWSRTSCGGHEVDTSYSPDFAILCPSGWEKEKLDVSERLEYTPFPLYNPDWDSGIFACDVTSFDRISFERDGFMLTRDNSLKDRP